VILLSRRGYLALAVVADIAIHARPAPVAAKALAARLDLPPRHLEALLQALVHANILKGVRGPRGGYELARERRRITAASVLCAASSESESGADAMPECPLVRLAVAPLIEAAGKVFLAELETITIDDICRRAEDLKLHDQQQPGPDFTI
jgi:Rrf2 family transcriptional regulator, iron-sulfur cluster assembly transcription factor